MASRAPALWKVIQRMQKSWGIKLAEAPLSKGVKEILDEVYSNNAPLINGKTAS